MASNTRSASGRQRGKSSAIALCVVFLLVAGTGPLKVAPARAGDDVRDPVQSAALQSARATESLLLDVARAADRIVAVGEWGHVVLSDDGGESWRQARSVPTRATLTSVFFLDAEQGWAVGHDAVVLHTGDGGETWVLQHAAPEEERPLLSVWFGGASHGIAVGAFGALLVTHDGGESWTLHASPGGDEDDGHLNEIFAGPEDSLFIAAERGVVHRSKDLGKTWQLVSPGYPGSFWGGLTLANGNVIVYGMRGHIFRSEDGGENWSELSSGTDKSLSGSVSIGGRHVVIVGLGGVVLDSRDGGDQFRARIQPGRRSLAATTRGSDGQILLFGETGIERIAE